MPTWTSNELTKIGSAEELKIASLRRDGTLRKPVIIWVVRLGDDLYVRSVNGRTASWFRVTQVRHEGRIQADGIDKDVAFRDATPDSTTRSTPSTAANTAATLPTSSTALSALRHDLQPLNLYRVSLTL